MATAASVLTEARGVQGLTGDTVSTSAAAATPVWRARTGLASAELRAPVWKPKAVK